MTLQHPEERASWVQSANVYRLVGSWAQQLPEKPRPQTLLQEKIDAWVEQGGRSGDEVP